MNLSRIASVLSFFGALAIGIASGYIADDRRVIVALEPRHALEPVPVVQAVAVRAEDLRGVWSGTWGYGRESCTIEIDRIKGEKFYGTLRKEGAEIVIAGSLDADGRKVYFRETRVLRLGPEMSEWSLGTNTGSFSPDARTLTGIGSDKWGTYGWDASKD